MLCVACPPVFTTDPHGQSACRASASHHVFPKLWKCILHWLRHPGRSGAKGLQVHLLPVFRRFWLRRGYQPSRKWAVAALDLLKLQGKFPAYFMKKKYSSIWSSLIPIKHMFLLQALCCRWSVHKNYIQYVRIWYWSCYSYDWLCRSWFINTLWRKTFIWIGTWIQIPCWQGCTILTISIHPEWFLTSH